MIMEENKTVVTNKNTKIIVNNLNSINLTGVTKVFSATESLISLKLADTDILIEGEKLHVIKLDVESGIVDVEGQIFKIKQEKNKQSKNIFKRIFK